MRLTRALPDGLRTCEWTPGGLSHASPSLQCLAPSISQVPLSQPGVPAPAHCPCPEKQVALQKAGVLKDHLGAGLGTRLATGHAKRTASHHLWAPGRDPVPPNTLCIAPLSHLLYFPSISCSLLISSPWAVQSIHWFSWGLPPPAQEPCSLLCHEQQPPSEVASLLSTCTWKTLHISIKRCCKHLKELEVRWQTLLFEPRPRPSAAILPPWKGQGETQRGGKKV